MSLSPMYYDSAASMVEGGLAYKGFVIGETSVPSWMIVFGWWDLT